ncbi:hypothetical protein ACTHQY_00450 [Rhodococcoides corynebacterioides]|uniref:hypothetical protein n=1 Tax=Rhodococcoides corynebacterioides TaxID=53972 RepID=UPI003F7EAD8B
MSGTLHLLRLAVRTERVATPVGVLVVPALLLVTAASLAPLYPDARSRADLAAGAATNPVFRILLGPLRDTPTIGPIAVWRVGLFAMLAPTVIVAATVTRNLRAPEATGRMELVRAVVVDQVVTASRTALTTSAVVLVTAYVVRGVGDSVDGASWLTWLSPLGWAERVDPFGNRTALPALACSVLFAVGVGLAARIAATRDLGSGLIHPRPGAPSARWPISPVGITVRTTGSALAPWMSGAFAYCLLVGVLTDSVDGLVGNSGGTRSLIENLGGGSVDLVGALFDTVLGVVAIAAAAVSVVGHLRDDDRRGRAEVVLATAVSPVARLLAAAAVAAVVAVVAALVLVLAAAGLVVGSTIVGGPGPWGVEVAAAAIGQVPPTLAVAAVAFAAYGFGVRWVVVGWIAVVADLLLGPLGPLIGAPAWLRDLAPHAQVPARVGAAIPVAPTIVVSIVAVALVAVGLWALRRRDLT